MNFLVFKLISSAQRLAASARAALSRIPQSLCLERRAKQAGEVLWGFAENGALRRDTIACEWRGFLGYNLTQANASTGCYLVRANCYTPLPDANAVVSRARDGVSCSSLVTRYVEPLWLRAQAALRYHGAQVTICAACGICPGYGRWLF